MFSNQLGTYNGAHAFSKTADENSRHLMGKKLGFTSCAPLGRAMLLIKA
jgi:hypothetical protein